MQLSLVERLPSPDIGILDWKVMVFPAPDRDRAFSHPYTGPDTREHALKRHLYYISEQDEEEEEDSRELSFTAGPVDP